MAREITLPDRSDEPSQADVNAMGVPECAAAIREKLADYKRRHGLAQNAGLGMMLLARAMVLLDELLSKEVTSIKCDSNDHAVLVNAVRDLYYAAFWKADRPVEHEKLWTAVRDAAHFEAGGTSSIPESDSVVVLVHKKHFAMIQSTLAYLQQTDPA